MDLFESHSVEFSKCIESVMEQTLGRDWYYDDIEKFTLVNRGDTYMQEVLYKNDDNELVYLGLITSYRKGKEWIISFFPWKEKKNDVHHKYSPLGCIEYARQLNHKNYLTKQTQQ